MGKTADLCFILCYCKYSMRDRNKKNASKLRSNLFVVFSGESINFCQLLFNLNIMFSGLAITSVIFVFIETIIVCT